MHFQLPPYDHSKIVTCLEGKMLDVVLDLRLGDSYGKYADFHLEEGQSIYIPSGFAHGFLALTNVITHYSVSTPHNSKSDTGIKFDSFGYKWEEENPIISDRDKKFVIFNHFQSPFKEIK